MPTQITTQAGHRLAGRLHRFHRSTTPRDEMVVLCFWLVNGRVGEIEELFADQKAHPGNAARDPARYVAQVQISSTTEDSIRAAGAALADMIIDFLPDPSRARPGPPGLGVKPLDYLNSANDEGRLIGTEPRGFKSYTSFK